MKILKSKTYKKLLKDMVDANSSNHILQKTVDKMINETVKYRQEITNRDKEIVFLHEKLTNIEEKLSQKPVKSKTGSKNKR